jgi:Cell Wall Hydrolase
MTVTPKAPFDSGDILTALCVWREARGCNLLAKTGVVWVLMNRKHIAPAQGFANTIAGNILKPWAFSSFNASDPNSQKYPANSDPSWMECKEAVAAPGLVDPTNGAVFYFSRPLIEAPKGWGNVEVSAVIDGLTFCRLTA